MKIVIKIVAHLLIISGMFVMLSSSMTGGGISGLIGLPMFIVGLGLLFVPDILQKRAQLSGSSQD